MPHRRGRWVGIVPPIQAGSRSEFSGNDALLKLRNAVPNFATCNINQSVRVARRMEDTDDDFVATGGSGVFSVRWDLLASALQVRRKSVLLWEHGLASWW